MMRTKLVQYLACMAITLFVISNSARATLLGTEVFACLAAGLQCTNPPVDSGVFGDPQVFDPPLLVSNIITQSGSEFNVDGIFDVNFQVEPVVTEHDDVVTLSVVGSDFPFPLRYVFYSPEWHLDAVSQVASDGLALLSLQTFPDSIIVVTEITGAPCSGPPGCTLKLHIVPEPPGLAVLLTALLGLFLMRCSLRKSNCA